MVLKDEKQESKSDASQIASTARKPRNLRALAEEYRFEASMSLVERAAHFFDFLARRAPYQYCPPNLALKAIMGYARLPKETGDEVLKFRDKGSAIRKALGRTYGRGLNVDLGMMRATVDDDDLASTQQVREVKRVRSSIAAVKRTNDLISPSKVRNPAVRKWLGTGVAPLLKTLEEDDRIFRLLPAKEEK